VARFDGNDTLIASTAADWKFLHDGTKYRIWVVSKTTVNNSLQCVFGTDAFTTGAPGWANYFNGTATTSSFGVAAGRVSGSGAYWGVSVPSNHYDSAGWNINETFCDLSNAAATNRIVQRHNAASPVRINASTATPESGNPTYPARISSIRGGSAVVFYWSGSIAEIIIILGDESAETDDKVWGYLAHKWGLAANLPADHPYKSAAPTK
jgi:hypothetical protein